MPNIFGEIFFLFDLYRQKSIVFKNIITFKYVILLVHLYFKANKMQSNIHIINILNYIDAYKFIGIKDGK